MSVETAPAISNETTLNTALRDLAIHRDLLAVKRAMLAARQNAFNIANADLIADIKAVSETVATQEATAREMGYKVYLESRLKVPAPGIGIRMKTVFHYELETCRNWAMEHGHVELLKLDQVAFEKVAGILKAPTFTVSKAVTVTIAQDLNRALGLEPEPTQQEIEEDRGDQLYHEAQDYQQIVEAGGF